MTPADQTAAVRLRLAIATVAVIAAACGGSTATTSDRDVESAGTPSTTTLPTTLPSTMAAPATTAPPSSTTSESPTTTVSDRCVRVTDFDEPNWFIVNDGVMGGRSDARGMIDSSRLEWSGTIVTVGGGFSSIRGLVGGSLAGATELQLRIRTDGRAYELLADDDASTRVTHYNPIPAVGGDWEVVVVPLTGMKPRVFGNLVTSEPFDPDQATQIGVILTDGIDGEFTFEIDWIDACA